MSLLLTKEEIINIINKKNFFIEREKLVVYLNLTRLNFLKYSKNVDNNFGNEKHINPLLWQVGHVVFFYINYLKEDIPILKDVYFIDNITQYLEFYDSYLTPLENRNGDLLLNYEILIRFYNKIIGSLIDFCSNLKLTYTKYESYLIMLCILHNEMHNEAFIFTKLSITNIIDFDITSCREALLKNIEFIKYPEGVFIQGFIENENSKKILSFDNENPCFKKKIKEFSVSKYPITENMFLEFIKNDGYKNNEYWCRNSLLWRDKNNIKLPLYWKYENNSYFKILNNTKYSVETNLPITNISYFEAKAYCRWKNVRLPTESEYEYISTNMGRTLFPWGDSNKDTNVNYKNYILSVKNSLNIPNFNGVMGLIGNVSQWCEESIYPYNGFHIDPIYREMTYPFFGFKKICKGGSFATSNFLIHPKYRNAQYPDCRIQFIGFRVCKN